MKYLNIIVIIVLCSLKPLNAQDTTSKIKIYKTWISLTSEPFNISGVLYEVKDSSILVSSSFKKEDYHSDSFEIVELQIRNIEEIKVRKKNNIGKGAWVGALFGLGVGGIIGMISGDDPPGSLISYSAADKAMMMGFSLAVIGSGAGTLIGLKKKKIPINGNLENYYFNKSKLKEYSIVKE